jgi:hypothetical protein
MFSCDMINNAATVAVIKKRPIALGTASALKECL